MRKYRGHTVSFSDVEQKNFKDFFTWKGSAKTEAGIAREDLRDERLSEKGLFTKGEIQKLKTIPLRDKLLRVIIALRADMVQGIMEGRLDEITKVAKKTYEVESHAHPEKKVQLRRSLEREIDRLQKRLRKEAVEFAAEAHIEHMGTSALYGFADEVYPIVQRRISIDDVIKEVFATPQVNDRLARYIRLGETWY